jgi:membrane-bound serine protease (ClpP class)
MMAAVACIVGYVLAWMLELYVYVGIVFAVDAVNRIPRRNVQTGREALIGALGMARTELAPAGLVTVQGELWSARADGVIPAGQRVRVLRVDGLRLAVRKEESTA